MNSDDLKRVAGKRARMPFDVAPNRLDKIHPTLRMHLSSRPEFF